MKCNGHCNCFSLLFLAAITVIRIREIQIVEALPQCPEPSPVANSFRTRNESDSVVTFTYTCVDGYDHTAGSLTRTCDANTQAVFIEDPPVCTLNCSAVRAIASTTNNATSSQAYSLVAYTCTGHYTFPSQINKTVFCNPVSGQWQGDHTKMACRETPNLQNAATSQFPDPAVSSAAARLAVDNSISTCSSTESDYYPKWSVQFSNQPTDVIMLSVWFRLLNQATDSLKLSAEVLGGLVSYCGRLNMTRVIYTDNITLQGNISCSAFEGMPFGTNLSLSASFDNGNVASTLQLCEVELKTSPHTVSCNTPPRLPRLKLLNSSEESFNKGDTARYACQDFYTPLSGTGYVTCKYNTEWTTPSLHCTDEKERIVGFNLTNNASQVEIRFELRALHEVYGVYIDLMIEDPVSVTTAAGKRCLDKQLSDTAMYISCRYQPVTSSLAVDLPVGVQYLASDFKVFGRVYDGALECLQSRYGMEFKGMLNLTQSGYRCISWSDSSLPRTFILDNFPDDTLEAASNFCRNPAGTRAAPWCYYKREDSTVSWEFCEIYQCAQICRVREDGADYQGDQEYTVRGKRCVTWAKPGQPFLRPLDFSDARTSHRKCRNPASSQSRPWCFVGKPQETDLNIEGTLQLEGDILLHYEHCDIPPCPTSANVSYIRLFKASVSNHNSSVTECHTTYSRHFAAASLAGFVDTECSARTQQNSSLPATFSLLCRSSLSPYSGSKWTYAIVFCDENQTITTLTPSMSTWVTTLSDRPGLSTESGISPSISTSSKSETFQITLSSAQVSSTSPPRVTTLSDRPGLSSENGIVPSLSTSAESEKLQTTLSSTQVSSVQTSEKQTERKSLRFGCCRCQLTMKNNMSELDRNNLIRHLTASIQNDLTVDKHNLSRTIRKKSCAADERPLAVSAGSVGVLLLAGLFLIVCILDLINVLQRIG